MGCIPSPYTLRLTSLSEGFRPMCHLAYDTCQLLEYLLNCFVTPVQHAALLLIQFVQFNASCAVILILPVHICCLAKAERSVKRSLMKLYIFDKD